MSASSFPQLVSAPPGQIGLPAYGTAVLASTMPTARYGAQIMSAQEAVAEFRLTESSSGGLRKLLDEVERFAVGGRTCIGFVTYEAMVELLGLPVREHHPLLPRALFFGYDTVRQSAPEWRLQNAAPEAAWLEPFSREDYLPRCREIIGHIRDGECYQANLTARAIVRSTVSPTELWERLARGNPVPYAALLSLGDITVISASPERFFRRDGDQILSSPIKGTARLTHASEIDRVARELRDSPKNRAELLMIVDLIRNDLGRIARTGSVTVSDLCRTEPYSRLVHLVADISATIETGTSLADMFQSLAPGGSITGAPKRRAVEILQEIETAPRGIYTGAIGYVTEGRAEFNIAIRTLVYDGAAYELHAGGGIVADSTPADEFDELCLKAAPLLSALGISA